MPSVFLYSSISLVITLATGGCARSVYRRQADRESYRLIDQKAGLTGVNTVGWRIERDESSRLHDAHNLDHPPMPEDDPKAHELMRTGPRSAKGELVSDEHWKDFLPKDSSGTPTLSIRNAVEVAARNSRDFQSAREDLYLSALDLSEQRYEFRPHLNLGTTGSRNEFGTLRKPGGQPKSNGQLETEGGLSVLGAWGTQLIVDAVNTIIWDFDQPKVRTATSLLNFSIIQPLMRFGGRARVLEPLTQAERHLLSNVRRMEQFQQGFYIGVIAGRDLAPGPQRATAAQSIAPSLAAGSGSGVAGTPEVSGYLGILQEQLRIQNLESNVAGLRSSLEQLEAAFDAGRASSLLQVLQARQALLTAQSSLLTSRAAYAARVDAFKSDIGLPPALPLTIRDSFLDRFSVFDEATTTLQNRVNDVASRLHDRDQMTTIEQLAPIVADLLRLQPAFRSRLQVARRDIVSFSEAVPERQKQFAKLNRWPEVRTLGLEAQRLDPRALYGKAVQADQNLAGLQKNIETAFAELDTVQRDLGTMGFETARARASVAASSLAGFVLELSLDHAASRIEAITLPPAELEETRAYEIARSNRLDWMNARAELVDAWRKIDYHANPLMSGLDLSINGALGTTQGSGSHFDARAGQLRGALHLDTPLDRLRERNQYREALIDYQRARRNYMKFEDNVSQSLRNTLRLMRNSQLNFEIRRAAVQSAIAQVDLARLKLEEPPRPGQSAQIGATAARDLVSALSDLLNAQNGFLALWVGNEVLRMSLDYELGLMEIDDQGHWVPPGPFTREHVERRLARRISISTPLADNSPRTAAPANSPSVIR